MTINHPYKESFPPCVDSQTRLLILGSLPGEASLAAGQYYAHPRNHFWRLIGEVLQIELSSQPYSARLQTLLKNRIGLWDIVARAQREGSLDSQLREVVHNDFTYLRQQAPALRVIACNGGESWRRTTRQHGSWLQQQGITLLALPSSSPAYTLSFEKKREAWLQLREWLHE